MPELNMDCVRDMMLYLETHQTFTSRGRVNLIKMKHVYPSLEKHTREDCYQSAHYIFHSRLVTSSVDCNRVSPKFYVFAGFTQEGYQFLKAVHDDTIWAKIKSRLSSGGSTAVSAIIEAGVSLLLG